MRKSELTILLPPATLDDGGNITSRIYPLTITGTVYTPMVYVDDVHISPGNGVVDVAMTGEGLYNRQHTIGVSSTALPQAVATEMHPLEIRLLNLNPDSAVHVTVLLSSVEARSSGPPVSFGGAVRFRGMLPLGTDGERPANMGDRAGDKSVMADGPLWGAVLTVNDTFAVRNIRDITSQIRVLSPTGTGKIPVTGGSRRVIIVKKDGVTLEVEAESLDFRNIFDVAVTSGGNVQILGLLADAVAGSVIQNGTIVGAKLADESVDTRVLADASVTPAKLDRGYADSVHGHSIAQVTGLASQLSGKANTGHTHLLNATPNIELVVSGSYITSGVLMLWPANLGTARTFHWLSLRIDGATNASGTIQLQYYDGSIWRNIDSASVNITSGLGSNIVLMGYLGNPGNTTYRINWVRVSGTLSIINGSVMQIPIPTSV